MFFILCLSEDDRHRRIDAQCLNRESYPQGERMFFVLCLNEDDRHHLHLIEYSI